MANQSHSSLLGIVITALTIASTAQATPSIGVPTIDPEVVIAGTKAKGIVTSLIIDSQQPLLRVRVERFDPIRGWRRAGTLRDRGRRRVDLERGDMVFSGRIQIPTTVPGEVRFRLAVRLKGELTFTYSQEFTALILADSLPLGIGFSSDELPVIDPATGETALCDEVVVTFQSDGTVAERQGALARASAVLIGVLDATTWQVRIPCTGDFAGIETALAALRSEPVVAVADPNYLMRTQACPAPEVAFDPSWALDNISVEEAWQVTAIGMPVGVIDTGVNYAHEEFEDAQLVLARDWVDLDDDPSDIGGGHGTGIAGILSAKRDGFGTDGVTRSLLVVERAIGGGGYVSHVRAAAAIRDAARRGTHVINCSFAGMLPTEVLRRAVAEAIDKGTVIVAAAGNNGCNTPFYPAGYPNVIAVGGSARSDAIERWAEFEGCCDGVSCGSNWGSWVSIYAPAVDILTPTASDTCSYGVYEGTSVAAPFVSGVAAMMRRLDPSLTPKRIGEMLRDSADNTGSVDPGGGAIRRLNGRRAICAARPAPAPCTATCPCDSDADGVPDTSDTCPGTSSGMVVDASGCACAQKTCDDAELCTDDSCNPTTAACVFSDNNAACDDGNACTLGDQCDGGTCQPGSGRTCGNDVAEGSCAEECDGTDDAACPGLCQPDCSCGAAPTPTPPTQTCGNNIREGTEACDGGDTGSCPGTCTVSCTCAPVIHRVFVTSIAFNGYMNGSPGLAGADVGCQDRANAAGLGGVWKAWLSDSNTDARDRVTDGQYRLVDGVTVIADSLSDLLDCGNPTCLQNGINRTEFGAVTNGGDVITSTRPDGTSECRGNSALCCYDWSAWFAGVFGQGAAGLTNEYWTSTGSVRTCDLGRPIYCFEQ